MSTFAVGRFPWRFPDAAIYLRSPVPCIRIRKGQDSSGNAVAVKIMEKEKIAKNGLVECVQREVG